MKKEEQIPDTAGKKETIEANLRKLRDEVKEKSKVAQEAMMEGKGRLKLEKPIRGGGEEITELVYDFTELTGLDYIDAMDGDPAAQQIFKITYRQALNLFARAAQKQTDGVDARDITEQIGMTDAVEAVQLATLFFSASARAGRLRISRR